MSITTTLIAMPFQILAAVMLYVGISNLLASSTFSWAYLGSALMVALGVALFELIGRIKYA